MATKSELEIKVGKLEKEQAKFKKLNERVKKSVLVPVGLLDDLLTYVETGDRVSLRNVAATIRELAENEQPERFKSHRHGV